MTAGGSTPAPSARSTRCRCCAAGSTGCTKFEIGDINALMAEVYVDGYYAGVVNDFDGLFQKLTIDGGQHHVELRAPGFETLGFDVQIEPNHTTTYRGELTKSPQE